MCSHQPNVSLLVYNSKSIIYSFNSQFYSKLTTTQAGKSPPPVKRFSLVHRSRYFGYTSFVPTIPKNVLFHNCECVKTVFQNCFSTSLQKLKVPYHQRYYKIRYIQSISVTNWRDGGYKQICPRFSVYAIA